NFGFEISDFGLRKSGEGRHAVGEIDGIGSHHTVETGGLAEVVERSGEDAVTVVVQERGSPARAALESWNQSREASACEELRQEEWVRHGDILSVGVAYCGELMRGCKCRLRLSGDAKPQAAQNYPADFFRFRSARHGNGVAVSTGLVEIFSPSTFSKIVPYTFSIFAIEWAARIW